MRQFPVFYLGHLIVFLKLSIPDLIKSSPKDVSGQVLFAPFLSLSDDNVYSSTRRPNLVHLEEGLIESCMDPSLNNIRGRIIIDKQDQFILYSRLKNKFSHKDTGFIHFNSLRSPFKRYANADMHRHSAPCRANDMDFE